jgi:hypothetical protein
MNDLYFPGWSFCTKAKNFDRTARNRSLPGFGWKELNHWVCGGAAFPLATDTLMAYLPLPSSQDFGQCDRRRVSWR